MQTAYRAESIVDAQIAKDALEAAGIPAFVVGAALMGAVGQLPARDFIRVLVPDAALVDAARVLEELFGPVHEAGSERPLAGRLAFDG